MRKLRLTKGALDNLADITEHIALEAADLGIGKRFVKRLRQKCERLATLPGALGRVRPELGEDVRSTPFEAYVIFFRYHPDTLEVVAIMEGHRDAAAYFSRDKP